jgi:pyrimidine-nucleoside phosphorylase
MGAFMRTVEEAKALAHLMVDIGRDVGRDMVALISDMNQPLGEAVGNALEVREAIESLRGEGPQDLREHCLTVAAHMVRLARQDQAERTLVEVIQELTEHLESGAALAKLRELVAAQGGDARMVDDPDLLPCAQIVKTLEVPADGHVAQISALEVAYAAVDLGAGREKKGDPIDHAVGVLCHLKVGDQVKKGDPAFTIYANRAEQLEVAQLRLEHAVDYRRRPQAPLPLFYDTITG